MVLEAAEVFLAWLDPVEDCGAWLDLVEVVEVFSDALDTGEAVEWGAALWVASVDSLEEEVLLS